MTWYTITGAGTTTATKFYGDITNNFSNMFNGVDVSATTGAGVVSIHNNVTWTFGQSNILISNPAATHKYTIQSAAISADRTLTLPILTGTDTIAVLALQQTFTNKNLNASNVEFIDNGDNTKILAFSLTGITTGNTRTLTIPDVSSTIAVTGLAQTFTATQTITTTAATALVINPPSAPTGSSSEFVGAVKKASGTIAFATTAQTGDYISSKFDQSTLTNPSSGTVPNASTLKIVGAPIASTNVTITNNYALWVAAGTSKFDGQINATGKIVQTLSTTTGTGISVALTTTQANTADQADEPLRLQHTVSASSASNALIVRGIGYVFTNSLTGGGAVGEVRAISLEAPTTSSGAVTTNYKHIAFYGASQTGTITNHYGLFFDATFTSNSSTNYAIFNNSTAQTYLGGTLQVQGVTTLNNTVNITGALTVSSSTAFATFISNSSGTYPGTNNTTLSIGSNFSSGNGEINFWNCQVTPSFSFNFMQKTGASAADKLIEIGTGGLFTTYAKRATAGIGVVPVFGSTLQKAETGADTNVLTITPPAVAGRYRASVTWSVSAATAATMGWTLAWTDSNGHAQTPANLPFFTQNSTIVGLTNSVSANVTYSGSWEFDVDNSGANIIVKTTFSGTSVAYKISAQIEQLA